MTSKSLLVPFQGAAVSHIHIGLNSLPQEELSNSFGRFVRLTFGVLLISQTTTVQGANIVLGSDPIGSTSSSTDNLGGFTAVLENNLNLGEPAVAVSLTGQEALTEFRVVVFGVPSNSGRLMFDNFDYRLKFWKLQDYFNNADPEFIVNLGDPMGLNLVPAGPTSVLPDQSFGNAGILGNYADSFDFHFDLTSLPMGGPSQQILDAPLAAGDWAIAFQSWHDVDNGGFLRVAGSRGPSGPIPLFSRDNLVSRGILGGQDPSNIALSWGISVTATIPSTGGDFNGDGSVDGGDLAVWQSSYGIDGAADADGDGDSDGIDFLAWQRSFGSQPQISLEVPEPSGLAITIAAFFCILQLSRSRQCFADD